MEHRYTRVIVNERQLRSDAQVAHELRKAEQRRRAHEIVVGAVVTVVIVGGVLALAAAVLP